MGWSGAVLAAAVVQLVFVVMVSSIVTPWDSTL
jgi:hypothetical protein